MLEPMSETPDGSNFFSALETSLEVDGVAAIYERAGWKCHLYVSGAWHVETDWADLILERGTDDSLLLHGPVADVEVSGELNIAPLLRLGIAFTAEAYAEDGALLREWRSGAMKGG